MGYRYDKTAHDDPVEYFRAVEISGSLQVDHDRKIPVNQVMLLSNDMDTLFFAEHNMSQLINNAVMMLKIDHAPARSVDGNNTLGREIEALLESIIMSPEKHVLHDLTASLKKAILAIALDRFKANKELICKVLGLSSSQLDKEMRSSGLAPLTNKERQER